MYKEHIIIGYGAWAKKIINFLIKNKLFEKIIVVRQKKQFIIYPNYKLINKKELKKIYSRNSTGHICSDNKTHYKYFELFNKLKKKFIIEKPLINSKSDLKKISKIKNKKKILVNYIDLFNSNLIKIKKIINKNKKKITTIQIIYSGKNQKYKKKSLLINEWLDHPLSIILYLFNKFPKFKLIKFERSYIKKKNLYETVELEYKLKNITINILISNKIKKQRLIIVKINSKKYFFNLNNHKNKNSKSSFFNLYKNLMKFNKSKFVFNFSFHKKIFIEKLKVNEKIN